MKRLLQICFCLVLVVPRLAAAGGERLYFEHLSARQGLSQNSVTAIVQDRKGFIWIGTRDGLNRYDGADVRVFRRQPGDPHSLGSNYVLSLYADSAGQIWVGTDKGLYVYKPEAECFESFGGVGSSGRKVSGSVTSIREDRGGRIWIAENAGSLFCYDPVSGQMDGYPYARMGLGPLLSVQCVCVDHNGRVWLGDFGRGLLLCGKDMQSAAPYQDSLSGVESLIGEGDIDVIEGGDNNLYIASFGGIWELSLGSLALTKILSEDESGKPVQARCLLLSSEGKLLAGSESGLFIYDPVRKGISHMQSSYFDRYALSDNAIYTLFEDKDKGIWAGSWFGGVDYCRTPDTPFRKYYPEVSDNSLHGNHVREFCKDLQGRIWIGTEDGGLNVFDPATERFRFFEPSRDFTNVHGLCMVDDELWVGTFSKGLYVVDPVSMRIKDRFIRGVNCESLADNSIFTIARSADGSLYVGTYSGVQRLDRRRRVFEFVPELKNKFIFVLRFDSQDNLWAMTYDDGVYFRSAGDGSWRHFLNIPGDPSSLPGNRTTGCFEDSAGHLWVTTRDGGFARYLPDTESFLVYDVKKGLPSDIVFQMEESADGRLWLSTNQGLVSFHPEKEDFHVWRVDDGLLCDQYNFRSSFRDSDGTLYFGGIEGFVRFNPAFVTEQAVDAEATLTELQVNGVTVTASSPGSPLKKSIAYTDTLTLSYNQNSIALTLSAFPHQSTSGVVRCRMEGVDDDWMEVGRVRSFRYPRLSSGKYRFVVQSFVPGHPVKELSSLLVLVRRPWYRSVVAQILYGALLALLTVGIIRFVRWRRDTEYQDRIKEMERKSEKELYESRIQFYTQVAHEIRTPLTLIHGPLDHILQKEDFNPGMGEDLMLMKKNSDKLLTLINQLLDFRKIESAGIPLEFTPCDITRLIRESCAGFTYLIEEKGLSFRLDLPEEAVQGDINEEAFLHIIGNLLSNGVKYADSSLSVLFQAMGDKMVLETRNDGPVVPADMRESIFQPFVRYNAQEGAMGVGTGIGLVYARSLAEAHGGTLTMADDPQWNVFRLELPLHHEDAVTGAPAVRDVPLQARGQKRTLLLVEDHADMRAFERRELSGQYEILEAENGSRALSILEEKDVDLVVSDVMMPVMDGFQLCQTVKKDIRFSHIPVILLTAKTDERSKISGLELGADAYVEKPFSMDYLKANISSLLQNRENVRKALASSPLIPVSSIAVTDTDKTFIEDIYRIIAQNYSNTEFRMDDMASELHMSRTQFYRKIQGVLDMTPNDLLRLERLKHAAALLKTGRLRVSEVCYMTGFSSPSYFSKCFLKQFGVTPTDYSASTAES